MKLDKFTQTNAPFLP